MQCACTLCHLWPVRLYNIFPRYLTNGTIVGKEVFEHEMCVLIFFTNFVEIFLIVRRIRQDKIKYVLMSSCKVPVILVRFN